MTIWGLAGKITIFDEKFSTNADRVVMLPKEGISIDYMICNNYQCASEFVESIFESIYNLMY